MAFIDLYRSGYDRGYQEAVAGMRRLPKWELLLRSPTSLLPGVDTETYVKGYSDGYTLGLTKEHWMESNPGKRKEEVRFSGPIVISILARIFRSGR